MKKWLIPVIVVLIVSLCANVYLIKQNQDRNYAQYMIQRATAFLQTAAEMPINNTPENSTQERGALVASASAYLDSAAPVLDHLGIHHMQGIAMTLSQYSFPMMFPNRHYPYGNPEQMLSLVKSISAEFMSSGDLNKLQTTINRIYQAMPAKTRQEAYNNYVITH